MLGNLPQNKASLTRKRFEKGWNRSRRSFSNKGPRSTPKRSKAPLLHRNHLWLITLLDLDPRHDDGPRARLSRPFARGGFLGGLQPLNDHPQTFGGNRFPAMFGNSLFHISHRVGDPPRPAAKFP